MITTSIPNAAARQRTPGSSSRARAHRRQEGSAYVEFLVAFPIVLMFFLCLIQLSLLYVGKLSVQHAAGRAARAAVVVLPDNPSKYDGEAVNTLDPDTVSGSSSAIPGFSTLGVILSLGGSDNGSIRLNAIRSAAYFQLTPISPSVTWLAGDNTVGRSFESGVVRAGSGFYFAKNATAVTFYDAPAGTTMKWGQSPAFGAHQAITTRVTYLYNCTIPLANAIMCQNLWRIVLTNATARRELMYTANPLYPAAFAAFGTDRFVVLRAESTLPNQGAGYAYH